MVAITISDQEFEWDPAKSAANLAKHRIDFETAKRVFDDPFALIEYDDSGNFDEDRYTIIGMIDDLPFFVVFTERGPRTRIITARRANSYEQRKYHRG